MVSVGYDVSEYEQHPMQRLKVNLPNEFCTIFFFIKGALNLAQMHCPGGGGGSHLVDGKCLFDRILFVLKRFLHLTGLRNQYWIKK